jgi:phage baseplate assembly protein W
MGFSQLEVFMLLPDRLDDRIAEAIKHQIDNERAASDTSSDAWRSRCEVARVAMFSDAERSVFIHHVSERRGNVAAREIESQASTLRTNAIFFLARKPS